MTAISRADKDEAVAVELRLDRLARLYNSLDPSPFNEKEPGTADIIASIHHHFEWRAGAERRRRAAAHMS